MHAMRSHAVNAATLLAMVVTSEQVMFTLYHYNSYANNAALLRSSKPMIMRDIFLTRASASTPNPLSVLYLHRFTDCLINSFVVWFMVHPMAVILGWRHVVALYLGGGFASSFAYVFSTHVSSRKTNTRYDCACTSNGAVAALAALSVVMPRTCCVPLLKRTHVTWLGVPYLLKCTYDEYVAPRFVETRKAGMAEVRNWGYVGGVFFACIYATVCFRTRLDMRHMQRFYRNLRT